MCFLCKTYILSHGWFHGCTQNMITEFSMKTEFSFMHSLKKVPCFSSLYVSMCILSREDMWCIVIICSITAQLNSEVIHSEPFDWTKIYVQQDLIHLMLFYFWYSVYVVSLPKEANSAQCLCLQHTVSWYGNQKWKFLPYKNKRVNYTPLPSKMLEIHSPPLLC